MFEKDEVEDFFETVFRLDECDDVTEFLEFAQGKRHDKAEMLTATSQLLTKGRIRSAYILAMLLGKRGQRNLLISIALSVGGLIFRDESEADKGWKYLPSQVRALSMQERKEVYDRHIIPLLSHMWYSVADRPRADYDRVLTFLRLFQSAVPEGFSWQQEMGCKVCEGTALYHFHGDLLERYRVAYYLCQKCGLLASEEPYWLQEAHTADRLPIQDDDFLQRHGAFRDFVALLLRNLFDDKAKFLDYGGGYGLFVRMMRDAGFDFYWQDDVFHNLFAHGCEAVDGDTYGLVTVLDRFQQFVDPVQEVTWIFERSDCLLFTVNLLPDPIPPSNSWEGYRLDGGREIVFYSMESLQALAKRLDLALLSNGVHTHMLSKRSIVSKKIFGGLSCWQAEGREKLFS